MTPASPSPSGGNKKAMWIVAAIIVLALIAWFAMSKKNDGGYQLQKYGDDKATQQDQQANGSTSLKELMTGSASQKCEFTTGEAGSTSQGTVYVANGKMRGDFTVTASGKTMVSHMINDGQTFYTWMDGTNTGYKMTVQSMDQNQSMSTSQSGSVDPNAKYDYNCSAWTADSAQFNLPANITFTDMATIMQNIATPTPTPTKSTSKTPTPTPTQTTSNPSVCGYCDTLGAEQKAQCRVAYACK